MAIDPSNRQIADRLLAFAALLELADANPYSARAYRRAAELIGATPASVAELVRSGRVRELRGIGPGIEARLRELVETGEIEELRELDRELRPELVGLGRLVGLGSKRMLEIGRRLDVTTGEELKAAAEEGRLRSVPGAGPATEAAVLAALSQAPRPRHGLTLSRSLPLLETIAEALGGHAAGDPRRYCELSFDLAVVVGSVEPQRVLDAFERHRLVVAIVTRGERHAVGVSVEGVPVRVVVVEPGRLGTELVRATGSPAYVESLGPLPDAPTEETVFARLGVAWRPPELREVPAVPGPETLIEPVDLRGDLHCHTDWSDGTATVEEMAGAARARGYEYLAICDHTANVRVVPGLREDDVRRQADEIARANERLAPFRVLRGIECDILADGSLDLAEDVLAELDWVQLSLHAGQRRPAGELTRIVTEAMRNPYVSALSHPKGRILNRRPENALELDAVFEVAREEGVALEINGLPDRLDLSGAHARAAVEAGVDLVLSSDAHSTRGLGSVELAVGTARRGGVPRERVVNAHGLDALAKRGR
jgi:DNA polymerase (family 10)